jgi:hypothetical protein
MTAYIVTCSVTAYEYCVHCTVGVTVYEYGINCTVHITVNVYCTVGARPKIRQYCKYDEKVYVIYVYVNGGVKLPNNLSITLFSDWFVLSDGHPSHNRIERRRCMSNMRSSL